MSNITDLAQRVRHWADMAALTSERASCLSVEQLEEIANTLESRAVTLPALPVLGSTDEWYQGFAAGAGSMREACAATLVSVGVEIIGEMG